MPAMSNSPYPLSNVATRISVTTCTGTSFLVHQFYCTPRAVITHYSNACCLRDETQVVHTYFCNVIWGGNFKLRELSQKDFEI